MEDVESWCMSLLSAGSVSLQKAVIWAFIGVICFHLAYEFDWLRGLIVEFLFCLVPLAHLGSNRKAFYLGLALGFFLYAPQLAFFWTIFNAAAIALWCVLALWVALFLLLSRQAVHRFGRRGLFLLPVLWLGLEFFRSELYYLRFSWLTPGMVFSGSELAKFLGILGVYGIGCLLFGIAAAAWALPLKPRAPLLAAVILGTSILGRQVHPTEPDGGSHVQVAGIQMEFPDEDQVLNALNVLSASQTNADLLVLSEYTFTGPVPPRLKKWCRDARKHLIVGAHDSAGEDYFNTAFVIGPDGEVVAKQAKSVPIQFFKDGLPAREQKGWESPWGKIGLAVCYDLSYRRVIDRLVDEKCQALIIPTMDVVEWGECQHRLHSRVAPMRAAELGIPIFRLCSSGISQAVHSGGAVTATAPFPGERAVLTGLMTLKQAGRMPLDHWLGPMAVAATGILIALFAFRSLAKKKLPLKVQESSSQN